jgi:hypothetical protein
LGVVVYHVEFRDFIFALVHADYVLHAD